MTTYRVDVRDADLRTIGTLSPSVLTLTPRWCDVGEWSLQVPAAQKDARLLDPKVNPGGGVVILRDSDLLRPVLTGPVGMFGETLTAGRLEVAASGPDDLVWVAGRLAYPAPSLTPEQHKVDAAGNPANPVPRAKDVRSGPLESVVKGFIRANAGQDALPARQVVRVAPDLGRGPQVTREGRFTPMLEVIGPPSRRHSMGWWVTQTGGELVFDVVEPVDRSGIVRFGPAYRNLAEYTRTVTMPSVTAPHVAGQGTGQNRRFAHAVNAATLALHPRWRLESLADRRDTDSSAELEAELVQAMHDGDATESVAIRTRDTEAVRFARDWRVGDRVTVEPAPGVVLARTVTEALIEWSAESGERVSTAVGSVERRGNARLAQRVRALERRAPAPAFIE